MQPFRSEILRIISMGEPEYFWDDYIQA